jgi:putative endonuclease
MRVCSTSSRKAETKPRELRRPADRSRSLGRHGEQLAADHLSARGFRILERNARTRAGEIDIIAFDGHTLVFAEVKTRRVSSRRRPIREDQQPLIALRTRQRARLRRLATAWLSNSRRSRPFAADIRFDAIGVLVDGRGALRRLDHIEGAW